MPVITVTAEINILRPGSSSVLMTNMVLNKRLYSQFFGIKCSLTSYTSHSYRINQSRSFPLTVTHMRTITSKRPIMVYVVLVYPSFGGTSVGGDSV